MQDPSKSRADARAFFISGIDTGVGKTVATGLMSRFLRARTVDHCTVKMVQTGCDGFSKDPDADPTIDEDARAETLRRLRRLGFPEVLARIPWTPAGAPPPDVDFSPLFPPDLFA